MSGSDSDGDNQERKRIISFLVAIMPGVEEEDLTNLSLERLKDLEAIALEHNI